MIKTLEYLLKLHFKDSITDKRFAVNNTMKYLYIYLINVIMAYVYNSMCLAQVALPQTSLVNK